MLQYLKFHTIIDTFNFLKKIKYFIQIGAHDGDMHDPIKYFILKNIWHGILVEPQQEMIEKIKYNYRNIENLTYVNAAVYKEKKNIILYKVKNAQDYSHTGWASVNSNRFENTIYKENYIEEIVNGIPLMDILKDNKCQKIDLLQIDTEGYDSNIIQMLDFNIFQPMIIHYEHVNLLGYQNNLTIKLLESKNYYIIKGKNDNIAILRNELSLAFLFIYFIIRLKTSIISRISNVVRFIK